MQIKQSDGTTSTVDCPAKGPCMIMVKADPKGGKVGSVSQVLGAPASKRRGKLRAVSSGSKVTDILPPASNAKEQKLHDSKGARSQQTSARGK
jgi:hypothetical protein